MIKLSICISTLNRGDYIEETLDTIIPQLNKCVELIIVDGNSSDNTCDIIKKYTDQNEYVKYFQESINSGVDGDYDKAIKYAQGEFCWLMTDDDLLELNAVEKVLKKIKKNIDLIIVNSKVFNNDYTKILVERQLNVKKDINYSIEKNNFFPIVGAYLSFIGCVVIRKNLWLSRNREDYFGTTFIHVGVICQNPPITNIYVISEPLILIRYGNAMWTANAFNVWNLMWPKLIWSFDSYSNKEKIIICREFPYSRISTLLYNKAMGSFDFNQLRKIKIKKYLWRFYLYGLIVCLIPGPIINFAFCVFFKLFRKNNEIPLYDLLISKHNKLLTKPYQNIL